MAAVLGLIPDALARAVEDLGCDLLARVGGQAVQSDRAGGGRVEQSIVDAVGPKRGAALGGGVLVAHGDPHVGVDGACSPHRLQGVVVEGQGTLGAGRQGQLGLQGVGGGRGDRHIHAGDRAEDRKRAGHVGAVAHIGQAQAGQLAESLAYGHQVGQGLARVVGGGEHVEDGDRGVGGQLLQDRVGAGPDPQGRDLTGEHQSGVAGGLAARELGLAGAQDHGVAAQLVYAHLEGHARARGGLLEDQGHPAPGQSARGEGRVLELDRAVQERGELA